MANIKAVIAVLVIIIVILAGVAIRFACWGWCKENYCPRGIECCKDVDVIDVVVEDEERRSGTPHPYPSSRPNAPPQDELEGETY